MTVTIIRFDNATELSISGIVKASIGGEDQQLSRLFSPANIIFADYSLHDFIKSTLVCIQVARNVSVRNLTHKFIRVCVQFHVVLETIWSSTSSAWFTQPAKQYQ